MCLFFMIRSSFLASLKPDVHCQGLTDSWLMAVEQKGGGTKGRGVVGELCAEWKDDVPCLLTLHTVTPHTDDQYQIPFHSYLSIVRVTGVDCQNNVHSTNG